MRKLSFAAACLLMAMNSANAAYVSPETALTAAKNFYALKTGSRDVDFKLSGSYKTEDGSKATVYVFEREAGNGFVLMSAEDRIQPVLAYSTESRFFANNGIASPEANYWVDLYSKQIDYTISNNLKEAPGATSDWKNWLAGGPISVPTSVTAVTPIMTTLWDQMPYYNYLCPTGTPTGCVATAMAQVMKFWDYPAQGTGQRTYSSSQEGGTLSANFGATTYDWANMPGTLTASSTSVQKTAIGTLMFHCGVAVEMNYTPSASGAQVVQGTVSARTAFLNHFGYKSSLRGYMREAFYSDYTWNKLLQFEIKTGRPVLYAGFGTSGGHAFIFDGFDEAEKYHVNWGWGGVSNGYFVVNNLNPGALGTGGGGGNFNYNQQALVMIEPPSSTLPANPWKPSSDNTTAISDVDASTKFLVYPNPATNQVSIDAAKFAGKVTDYVIYNSFGQRMVVAKVASNEFNINTATLGSGMYYIQLNTTEGIVTKPVSIVK